MTRKEIGDEATASIEAMSDSDFVRLVHDQISDLARVLDAMSIRAEFRGNMDKAERHATDAAELHAVAFRLYQRKGC